MFFRFACILAVSLGARGTYASNSAEKVQSACITHLQSLGFHASTLDAAAASVDAFFAKRSLVNWREEIAQGTHGFFVADGNAHGVVMLKDISQRGLMIQRLQTDPYPESETGLWPFLLPAIVRATPSDVSLRINVDRDAKPFVQLVTRSNFHHVAERSRRWDVPKGSLQFEYRPSQPKHLMRPLPPLEPLPLPSTWGASLEVRAFENAVLGDFHGSLRDNEKETFWSKVKQIQTSNAQREYFFLSLRDPTNNSILAGALVTRDMSNPVVQWVHVAENNAAVFQSFLLGSLSNRVPRLKFSPDALLPQFAQVLSDMGYSNTGNRWEYLER